MAKDCLLYEDDIKDLYAMSTLLHMERTGSSDQPSDAYRLREWLAQARTSDKHLLPAELHGVALVAAMREISFGTDLARRGRAVDLVQRMGYSSPAKIKSGLAEQNLVRRPE